MQKVQRKGKKKMMDDELELLRENTEFRKEKKIL